MSAVIALVNPPLAARTLDNGPIPITRRLVAGRLCALLRVTTRSARLAFKRATGFSNDDACMLAKIAEHGPMTSAELGELLSYDKGHVSRAVTRLVNERVLSRDEPNGVACMTRLGRATYARVLRLSKTRNAQIQRDLTEQQAQLLPIVIAKLEANARALLALELARQRTRAGSVPSLESRVPTRLQTSPPQPRQRLLIPDLVSLQNLIWKSAAMAVERELSLPGVDWQLISYIGEHSPLTRIELIPEMSQSDGAIARGLERTEALGLITRQKIGGGRHVLISITEKGRKTHDRIMQLALQRNTVLVRGVPSADQHELAVILDKLMATAYTLLAREEALAAPTYSSRPRRVR
jgi:DNA-binding MarR family transcriptional regulator